MPATTSRNVSSEIAFLARAMKAPSLAASVERLAECARAESWTREEFLAACLQREVAARDSHGGEGRIRATPARKSLEEFDYEHQRSLKRDEIAHLVTLDFVTGKEIVVFLGPPGTGKTHRSIGLGTRCGLIFPARPSKPSSPDAESALDLPFWKDGLLVAGDPIPGSVAASRRMRARNDGLIRPAQTRRKTNRGLVSAAAPS